MKKIVINWAVFLGLITGFSANNQLDGQQLAFPGAEGFGKYATGGRGGDVIEVTTTKDIDRYGNAYSGSLREALNTEGDDPITIVFRVSGIIELGADLSSTRSNVTIAGQTAPGDGICIKDYSVKLSGENLVIRYIRFRPGDETGSAETTCLNIENTRQIIVDHCSMSWSIEENMGCYDNDSVSVQWCILSESLYNSYHEKGARGYASQWGGQWASYHHNLLAHHNSRSPRFNGSHSNDYYAIQDFRNNVIYDYGSGSSIYGGENELFADTNSDGENDAGSFINFVANYLKPGPEYSGSTFMRPSLARDDVTPQGYAEWYITDNTIVGYSSVTEDNWTGVDVSVVGSEENIRVDKPHDVDSVSTYTADSAYKLVLASAGAIRPIRDSVDIRIINDVINGTGEIIDEVSEVGGWPDYNTPVDDSIPADSDHDGMPDYWEDENGLDSTNYDDGKEVTSDGYTNLEHYLNSDIAYIDPSTPESSIGSISESLAFSVYPTLASSFINITSEDVISEIEIHSLDGSLIKSSLINSKSSTLDISELSEGVYFLRAKTDSGKSSTTKFMVK